MNLGPRTRFAATPMPIALPNRVGRFRIKNKVEPASEFALHLAVAMTDFCGDCASAL